MKTSKIEVNENMEDGSFFKVNENMEDGSKWTPKYLKTKTGV